MQSIVEIQFGKHGTRLKCMAKFAEKKDTTHNKRFQFILCSVLSIAEISQQMRLTTFHC